MNKHILLLLSLLMAFGMVFGQRSPNYPVNSFGNIPCFTTENEKLMRAQYPDMETAAEFDNWINEKMRLAELSGNSTRAVLTIPVIVHVIHEPSAVGSGGNISAAQVQSQIDVLNEDFRRATGTPGFNNDPAGADAEIEFCLAFVDTAGHELTEPGIQRYDRVAMGWRNPSANPGFDQAYIGGTVAPAVIWDPLQYMNIFVVPNIQGTAVGTILGYANLPNTSLPDLLGFGTAPANRDGFVVRADAFGRVGNLAQGTRGGRTSTHEIGHWLGLHHVWGRGNNATDCTVDDYCADTPNKETFTFSCSSEDQCGTPDMFRNYMDYTGDLCMNIFTNCQVSRMRTVLMNSPRRVELTTSTVCARPTVAANPMIDFEILDPCSGKVVFRDTSGTLPTNWFWSFGDGNTSSLRRPIHTYGAAGTYTVSLVANNNLGTNSTSISVVVTATGTPGIDAGADISSCFGDQVQLNAVLADPSNSVRWFPTTGLSNPNSADPTLTATNSRTYYVTVTDAGGCKGTDTITIVVNTNPVVNAGADVTIQSGGFTQMNATTSSTNVVGWDWTPNYGFTTPVDRPDPVCATDRTVTYTVLAVDANGCRDTDKVIVTVPGTIPVSIDKDFETVGALSLPYPNPASQSVVFSGSFTEAGELSVSLYDITGKKIQIVHEGKIPSGVFKKTWDRPQDASSGVYLVVWEKDGVRLTQKVQLF